MPNVDMCFAQGSLLFGDCLDRMKEIPDGSVDMILCDLPYGTTQNKWDSVIPFEPLWSEYWRVAKDNAAVVLTASQPFTSKLVMSQLDAFKHDWIWQKEAGSNFANTVREPMKEHESVVVFSNGKWVYNRQMQERAEGGKSRSKYKTDMYGASENYGNMKVDQKFMTQLRVPSSVQKFSRERGLHPTQKPVALFEYLIRTYTNEGETVLDNCSGSGTTAIAAINTGRRFICIEKDIVYFLKSANRIINHV